MKKEIRKNRQALKLLFDDVKAVDDIGLAMKCDDALKRSIDLIVERSDTGGKLIFIGNGASASIASHMATDFWKNAGIRSIAFNDAALLTCVSNDYGYRHVFEKPVEMFADGKDVLIAISSSGRSENILLGAEAARKKGMKIITFSGFEENNPLKSLGAVNFYVPSSSYGCVEVVHLSLCHCLVDVIGNKIVKIKKER